MKIDHTLKRSLDGHEGSNLVILAQILILVALGLGLQFVLMTTGGTLFLAAAVAPGIATVAVILAAAVLIYRYQKAHSLFAFDDFEPGETIFQEGDAPDCAYFIRSGEVEVTRKEAGRDVTVARLKEGEYFGEMGLLSPHRRNATVRAVTKTSVGMVGKENFLAMLGLVRSTQDDVQKTVQQRAMKKSAGGGSTG
jgi:hypothetical protein